MRLLAKIVPDRRVTRPAGDDDQIGQPQRHDDDMIEFVAQMMFDLLRGGSSQRDEGEVAQIRIEIDRRQNGVTGRR